ncbi:hypothetical protein SAMN05444166_0166 [Singulisphaera sp. GP187]|uniref:hypothetical protein n=1 Tax=Singulisphaera sp. GP187 TaxID=1882752 RepID=UPI00092915BC|nr:hypothetical protein [Singulisphaera sp. GP187]SIN69319.1 hypothetical protein SAMN05444166_0166 [Singulisphaera sp. GP187]
MANQNGLAVTNPRIRSVQEWLRDQKNDELQDGFHDNYHGLMVGPCDRKTIRREESCRLLVILGSCHMDQFDCNYEEWTVPYRIDVYRAEAQGWPGPADPKMLLSPKQFADCRRAKRTGEQFEIESRHLITPMEGRWRVMTDRGLYLVNVEENGYAEDVEGYPTASFETPLEAASAYLWAVAIGKARGARYTAAMRNFGREERE